MKSIVLVFCLLSLLFLIVVGNKSPTKLPFIIDTDVDIDDTLAMMYMLNNDVFDVKAITTMGNAFTRLEQGAEIVTRLLTLLNLPSVPVVAKGVSKAITQVGIDNYANLPSDFIAGSESLYGLLDTLPVSKVNVSNKNATTIIYETATAAGKLNILAIGTLSNIAETLRLYPSVKDRIQRIYVMGGAVFQPGNLMLEQNGTLIRSNNTFAEYNIYLDPEAAQVVFSSGIPITLVPLDATRFVPMNDDFYFTLSKFQNSTIRSSRLVDAVSVVLSRRDHLVSVKVLVVNIVVAHARRSQENNKRHKIPVSPHLTTLRPAQNHLILLAAIAVS